MTDEKPGMPEEPEQHEFALDCGWPTHVIPWVPAHSYRELHAHALALREENERLRDGAYIACANCRLETVKCKPLEEAEHRAEQAESRLAEAQKDAERYRYIRDAGLRDYDVICESDHSRKVSAYLKMGDALDAASEAEPAADASSDRSSG